MGTRPSSFSSLHRALLLRDKVTEQHRPIRYTQSNERHQDLIQNTAFCLNILYPAFK